MNFDFSEDQRLLQTEVARVLAVHSSSAAVRKVLDGDVPYCAESWRQLADLGALGIAIPEDQGGAGMGLLELCLIAEEAGRALAAVPLLSSIYLASEIMRRGGSDAQRAQWLPRLAGGDTIMTTAIAASGHHVLPSEASRLADGRLSALFNAVPDAMAASHCIALAGDALVLVDLSGKGVTRTAQMSLDPTRPLAQLRFDGAAAETIIASGGKALAQTVTDGAAILLAFEQVGGAERALHAARNYVLERRAFGRVVGSFQAVKHKLADLYTGIELARAHAYFGAWALATGAPELARAAAAARVAATTAYNSTAEESMHLHGGIGYTWEMDCHIHLRRARWLGQIVGSEHYWRERLASQLIEEAA